MSRFYNHRGEQVPPGAADMFMPARCVCGTVYDLGKVEVTARYSDCSMWKAPCCGRTADDRYETGWSSVRHYYLLRGDRS